MVDRTRLRHRIELEFRRTVPRGRRRAWLVAALVVLALVAGGSFLYLEHGRSLAGEQPRTEAPKISTAQEDTDADGLSDLLETTGWRTLAGDVYVTDPLSPDTDGDGLTDGVEAGEPGIDPQTHGRYGGYSDPTSSDGDDDGLEDAAEADLGLDPLTADEDGDGLDDGIEVNALGTSAVDVDTDGDGFSDAYEEENREGQGLDPLWTDAKVSKWTYAAGYAKGAIAGDLWREDSLAWLAGNLTSGAASSIPVVGSIAGAVADARDAVGSAIHADWVGTGFSAVGAVPGGDVLAVPGKAAKFVARNPHLAVAVASIIATSSKIPETVQVRAIKGVISRWDELKKAGASDGALLRLQRGRIDLDEVAAAIARPTHVSAGSASFFDRGTDGEAFLEDVYGASVRGVDKQVWASTAGFIGRGRFFDVFVDGIAHESKVGYVRWSPSIENQIRKDAWLIDQGVIEGAHWHFLASSVSNTIGADRRMLDLLDELEIPFTIRLPASA